jgi:hypothetical protein
VMSITEIVDCRRRPVNGDGDPAHKQEPGKVMTDPAGTIAPQAATSRTIR